MRNRRDWGIIWVVFLAATCWYALYQHDVVAAWIRAMFVTLGREL